MGIFSFLSEKKLASKTHQLLLIQKDTYLRYSRCIERKDWNGAAIDSRMMLEAFSYIEHISALHTQNYGNSIDYTKKFGAFLLDVYALTEELVGNLSKNMLAEPQLKLAFIKQMASETSQWKNRMIWVVSRDVKGLEFLELDIQNALPGGRV